MIQQQPQPWTKESIQALLDRDTRAVVRAARAIYARQTEDEKATDDTKHLNGVGFNAHDAEPMSRFVRFANNGWPISEKFMRYARGRMKRYWRQLVEIANAQPSTPNVAVEPSIEPAVASKAPTTPIGPDPRLTKRKRYCTCEWSDGEPAVTCPEKRPRCCSGGKLVHPDIEEGIEFGKRERKQEEAAFASDVARTW